MGVFKMANTKSKTTTVQNSEYAVGEVYNGASRENGYVVKHQQRSEAAIKSLQAKLNKAIGQINGVKKMIDDNRYTTDILTQLKACEKDIQMVAVLVYQDFLETTVTDKIKNNDKSLLPEVIDMYKKLL